MLPMDSQSPFGLRYLSRCIERGQTVVLFPQGTGIHDSDRADRPGARWLIERSHPRIIALRLSGWRIAADSRPDVLEGCQPLSLGS